MQTVSGNVSINDFFQTGLIDWNAPGLECFYLSFIIVYANDIVTDVRKTGPRDEPHVAGTDD